MAPLLNFHFQCPGWSGECVDRFLVDEDSGSFRYFGKHPRKNGNGQIGINSLLLCPSKYSSSFPRLQNASEPVIVIKVKLCFYSSTFIMLSWKSLFKSFSAPARKNYYLLVKGPPGRMNLFFLANNKLCKCPCSCELCLDNLCYVTMPIKYWSKKDRGEPSLAGSN